MKFSQKYSTLKPFEVAGNVMRGTTVDHCHVCGALTDFVDLDFQCHVCSDECDDQLTWEFLTNMQIIK